MRGTENNFHYYTQMVKYQYTTVLKPKRIIERGKSGKEVAIKVRIILFM